MIVAFGHRRQVGKDTCAKFLETVIRLETSNSKILRQGFANKLYDICHQLYYWAGFNGYNYYLDHPESKEVILPLLNKSPRTILIEVGMKMREVYAETWIAQLTEKEENYNCIIIPDLRFENEAKYIKNKGGVIIKVTRPDAKEFNDPVDMAMSNHKNWDHIIENDGDLNQLYSKVTDLFKIINRRI